MKNVTPEFKQELTNLGRQLDSYITYGNTTLHDELYRINLRVKANLLKSVMKEIEIESSTDIALNTEINCRVGLKVGNNYEYIDYGNYIVYSSEKMEDEKQYRIVAYDKMLYSMKDYEALEVTYPITLKNYLIALLDAIGLQLENGTFQNEDRIINTDLYDGLGYTYRDILDEIAQATGSIIVINASDKVQVKYPNQTLDTIDENYFKDINVNFAEKYGPINSIVLSRAGESDNVYLQDEQSVLENGLCEVKIADNQIMNFNDRSDYLQGILIALDGLYYYANDYESTGILYYEVGDLYNVHIGENIYQCIMLNDDIDITTGLEENIYTEKPEQSQTDYTKADKTDRRLNETYLIVDKQNQSINAVISQVGDQNTKIAEINATVGELNTKIGEIADITISQETITGTASFTNINQSEPVEIKIHPIGRSISYLYPRNNLFPANNLYMPNRIIRFANTSTNEIFDYELPANLLYYDSNNYDEFILNYDSRICQVTKKVGYNADGSVYVLSTPTTLTFAYPLIELTDGDYTVSIPGYDQAYLFVRLMAQNIYTTQFTTKAEVNSKITQKATEIDLDVDAKLSNYSTTSQMNSAINLKADQITSSVSQNYATKTELGNEVTDLNSTIQQTANSITSSVSQTYATKTQLNDTATELNSTINQTADAINIEVNKKVNNTDYNHAQIVAKINDNTSQAVIQADKIDLQGTELNLTSKNMTIKSTNFNVDKNGNMICSNANVSGTITSNNATITGGKLKVAGSTEGTPFVELGHPSSISNPYGTIIWDNGLTVMEYRYGRTALIRTETNDGFAQLRGSEVDAFAFNNVSLAEKKKDFELLKSGLDIIQEIDIYKYRYKDEDTDKKHIGFVIGDKFNYSTEVTSKSNDGVDIYSFVSVCCKAIQELNEKVEYLENKLKKEEKENEQN